jgi:type IV secretory pathway VirB3-like protein
VAGGGAHAARPPRLAGIHFLLLRRIIDGIDFLALRRFAMADGVVASAFVLLCLFTVLVLLIAMGCMHGVFGFVLRLTGDRRITGLKDYRAQSIKDASTALVFPIHNEQVPRVCEGLRATYQSLQKTGLLDRFDFYILSDSTDPDKWVEEERRWFDLVQRPGRAGPDLLSPARVNEGKKSGNIRDFLSTWGARYRYFIVFDADSVMRGETLVDLVKLMEAHPQVGLIQTVPALVNAGSLVRAHATILQPPLRADLHHRFEFLGASLRQLLGAQRHHPHRAVHAALRPAAIARRQAVRRPDSEPRFRGGGAVAEGQLGSLAGLRSGRQLRGSAADDDRKRPARPPLVPGQHAARHGGVGAGLARGQPPAPGDGHPGLPGQPALAVFSAHI